MGKPEDSINVSIGEGEIILIAEVLRLHTGAEKRDYELAKSLTFSAMKSLLRENAA